MVVTVGAVVGTLLGGIAAYAGGLIEEAIMCLTDLVLCFPPIILALAIGAALGIGTTNTIIAMLVVWWPKFACLTRSLVLQQRSLEYVEAALVAGYGPGRILARHIIPNLIGPLIVLVTLDVGNAIIIFAGLSFLGLGVVPPTAEWGSMVGEGRELVAQWWVAAFPGFAILTIVLISHDLGVVRHICDRIMVLHLGQVAEIAPTDDLFTAPLHPYTRYLISAQPSLHGPARSDGRQKLSGELASVIDPPSGCRFRTRCPIARQICADAPPPLHEYRPGHVAACHFAGQVQ